jgi:oxygen-independent coproporphyrinogen-3 oxidase
MESLYPRYIKALKKEIVEHFFAGHKEKLQSIFFGGGTPSILKADQIEAIISCCREYPGFGEDVEISLEVNPKTVNFMKLLQLRQAGVNRLSIGVQSFIDKELNTLGRLHSAQDCWDCVRDAMGAGFVNISVDLMYGIPGQSAETWRWNLETALSLGVPHLSLYQLTIEENTPMARSIDQGCLVLPDEDEVIAMDEITLELCSEAGLLQYEISNYALPGFTCRHNVNYWENRDYLAAGAGGVGYLKGERWRNISAPLQYCEALEAGSSAIAESEYLSPEESFRESVVIGLRMVEGVAYGVLFDRYRIHLREYYEAVLPKLLDEGYVEFTDTHFRLTKKGRIFANQIMAELV